MKASRIGLILAPALLVLSMWVPAASGAPSNRRVEQGNYTLGGVQGVLGLSAAGQENLGAVRFAAGNERFVSVAVSDSSGLPVLAEVTQDYDGDTGPEFSRFICGSTDGPVRIKPGIQTIVYVFAGTCEDGTNSVPTAGTIRATFTRSR